VVFSFFLGSICGVAAPLALVLSMSGVETNRGASSALQGAIKMFFTGVFLVLFDAVSIVDFNSLIEVFMVFVLFLWVIFLMDFAREKRRRKSAAQLSAHASRRSIL